MRTDELRAAVQALGDTDCSTKNSASKSWARAFGRRYTVLKCRLLLTVMCRPTLRLARLFARMACITRSAMASTRIVRVGTLGDCAGGSHQTRRWLIERGDLLGVTLRPLSLHAAV